MGENFLELNSPVRVVTSLVFYVFMVWLLFPRLEGFARSYSTASLERMHSRTILVWEDQLTALDEVVRQPSVILSDPLTGYSIPAMTRHRTVSVLHQHGNPSDSLALERLKACRDVLSPYLGSGEKARLCRRFGVDFVLVNGALQRPVDLFFCNVGPGIAAAQMAALDRDIGLFRKRLDFGSRGALYEVRRENLDALAGIRTAGEEQPFALTTEELTRSILLRALPEDAHPVYADTVAGITLVAVAIDTTWVGRGERVGLDLYWKRVTDPPLFPVDVHVRFDTAPPRGRLWSLRLSKLHRRWRERRDKTSYRHRTVHAPLRGMLGVEHWPRDRIVADRLTARVSEGSATGEYEVKVRWNQQVLLPNYPLSHLLSDRDIYDGMTVGLLEIY